MLVINFLGRLSQQGGIQTVVRQLLRGIDADEFESHVCTIRSYRTEEEIGSLGNHQWHSLDCNGPLTPLRRLLVAYRLRSLFRRLRPDVVHVHSGQAWYAFLAGLGLGIRFILEIHDSPLSGRVTDKNNRLESMWIRRGWAQAVVHSTEVRDQVASYGHIPAQDLTYLPLAIDTFSFSRPSISQQDWKLREGVGKSKIVLYVARLVPSKNLPLFLEVARRVIDRYSGPVVFIVAGGGGELESLKRLADGLRVSGKILWIGSRYGTDWVDLYQASDIYLSTSDYEGFGLTLVEAMAAGKPVVSTAVGGTVDIVVDGETGRLCPAGDADSLASAVQELLNDPAKADCWGLAGQKRARERFDLPAFQAGFQAAYRRAATRACS